MTLTEMRRDDVPDLWNSFGLPDAQALYELLLSGPPTSQDELWTRLQPKSGKVTLAVKANIGQLGYTRSQDTEHIDNPSSQTADTTLGVLHFADINTATRSFEIAVILSPKLHGTVASTEAFYLYLRHAFDDTGHALAEQPFHRVVWKCNSQNVRSRQAAERLGLVFEGRIRKGRFVKGRWVDSDCLSLLGEEWPVITSGMEAWLDPGNFDGNGSRSRA